MEETRPFVSWDLVHDFMVDVFVIRAKEGRSGRVAKVPVPVPVLPSE